MEVDVIDYPKPARPLAELQPQHEFFIGIDSDGCAFDTMEIKHKECFAPNIIKHWGLQAVSKYAREAAEFVNLYSKWRGINRWPALVMVFDLLRERAEVQARGVVPPQAPHIRAFIADDAYPKSNDGLRAYMAAHPDPELDTAWAWTTGVNATVADMVHGVPPFPYVRESLEFLSDKADMIVVSATPLEALTREWHEHDIAKYVRVIAGQEMGKKALHLKLATEGKYAPDRVLMIGDAPGDMKAARANGALFYPINPGHEEASWQRFHQEAMHKFLAGEYAGAYEATVIAEFEKLLPETPPWS
ncbi:MAG: haloacid dehalogenase [Anaerolineaceae bacterium 4572_32.1]|nr:MAG: haloacid dehalogenase [Anaerolineaceae bacterium 4572_32.1]